MLSVLVCTALAQAAASPAHNGVTATFETPMVVHAAPDTHAWFSQVSCTIE
jgi:hypothetical protein